MLNGMFGVMPLCLSWVATFVCVTIPHTHMFYNFHAPLLIFFFFKKTTLLADFMRIVFVFTFLLTLFGLPDERMMSFLTLVFAKAQAS